MNLTDLSDMTAIVAALLGSVAFGAIGAALIAKASSDKAIKMENIVKERKEWRDKLRHLVEKVDGFAATRDSSGIRSVEAQLTVLLNPLDNKDMEILYALERIPENWSPEKTREFNDRVAHLLKHDWERVKRETGFGFSFQTIGLMIIFFALVFMFSYIPIICFGLGFFSLMGSAIVFGIFMIGFGTFSSLLKLPRVSDGALCWVKYKPYREPYLARNERNKKG